MKEYRKVSGLEALVALQQGKVLRQFYNKDLVKEIFVAINKKYILETVFNTRTLSNSETLRFVCNETWEVQCTI